MKEKIESILREENSPGKTIKLILEAMEDYALLMCDEQKYECMDEYLCYTDHKDDERDKIVSLIVRAPYPVEIGEKIVISKQELLDIIWYANNWLVEMDKEDLQKAIEHEYKLTL